MNQEVIKILYPHLRDLGYQEGLSQEAVLKNIQDTVDLEGTREGKKELKESIKIEEDEQGIRILTARLNVAESQRSYRNDFSEMMPKVPSRNSKYYLMYDRLANSRIELALAMSLAVGEASLFGFVSEKTNYYLTDKFLQCQDLARNFGHEIFGEKISGSEKYIWSTANKKKPKISDFGYAVIIDPNAQWDGRVIFCEPRPELLNLGFEFGGDDIFPTVEKVPYIRRNKVSL